MAFIAAEQVHNNWFGFLFFSLSATVGVNKNYLLEILDTIAVNAIEDILFQLERWDNYLRKSK